MHRAPSEVPSQEYFLTSCSFWWPQAFLGVCVFSFYKDASLLGSPHSGVASSN